MRRSWYDSAAPRVIALTLLFAAAAFIEAAHQASLTSLLNADFWWHLRTGLGILDSHALPHTGLYSQSSALPWMAASWLYDLKLAIGYRMFGLLYIPMIAVSFKLVLAVVTFLLAGGCRGRFWPAVLLSAIAQIILINLQPLPVCCSVLGFAVELLLLMECRRTGSVRPLYWLPLLFLLWANLDVQFVIGVFVLLLFVAATMTDFRVSRVQPTAKDPAPQGRNILAQHEAEGEVLGQAEKEPEPRSGDTVLKRAPQSATNLYVPSAAPPLNLLGAMTGASILATMITPYGWNLYGAFFARATSAANQYFPDFLALRFRSPQDYLLLLLVAAAFLALGMRRSRDLFAIALLLLCAFAAFHAQRDVWLATLAAVAVVASTLPEPRSQGASDSSPVTTSQILVAAGIAVALLATTAALHFPRGRNAALAEIGKAYPVAAADYIREHHLPPPLFNSLPWGGFLTWYLPEYPVAIDGRTDLYGDDFNIQYAKVMNANAHFSTFPALNQAGTLLLEKNSLMGTALASVPAFKVAYSDNVAVVLVREQPAP